MIPSWKIGEPENKRPPCRSKGPSEWCDRNGELGGFMGHTCWPPINGRGFGLWLTREQWGAVTDGLILERERCAKRGSVNPESTGGERASTCADIIEMIRAQALDFTSVAPEPQTLCGYKVRVLPTLEPGEIVLAPDVWRTLKVMNISIVMERQPK